MQRILEEPKMPVLELKETFERRKKFQSNRSSAVFPLRLAKDKDVILVFLNYWVLKSGLKPRDLKVIIRIYNTSGTLILTHALDELNNHNQISASSLLSEDLDLETAEFEGSIFFEVISIVDIKFPYPAVIGVFKCGDLYSAVHAAGRIKNSEEDHSTSFTEESNWTCKFHDGVTPFFHFFNGPSPPAKKYIIVNLRDRHGLVRHKREVSIADLPSFGSRTFFIKDIFRDLIFEDGDFVSVSVEHNSVFPRLVVGNYHENGFLEVTHSFPVIEHEDYCEGCADAEYASMLCLLRSEVLNLDVRVFPTNCPSEFSSTKAVQLFNEESLGGKKRDAELAFDSKTSSFSYKLRDNERFVVWYLKGPKVPARLNASFRYSVKGELSRYSTDIALGAMPNSHPPKYRHWGHGYCGDGYETTILIRNNSHKLGECEINPLTLTIYGSGVEYQLFLEIGADSSQYLSLRKIIEQQRELWLLLESGNLFSWFMTVAHPTIAAFWVCHRGCDGAIFGEHAF